MSLVPPVRQLLQRLGLGLGLGPRPVVRFESFGALLSLERPPLLLAVDRARARLLGLDGGARWDGPPPPGPPQLRAPVEAHLALTGRCPHHCPTCYTASGPQGRETPSGVRQAAGVELGPAEWQAALVQLAAAGVLQVALGGGESLLRPDLPELARLARELGLVPNLTCSGHGVDAAWAAQVAPLFGTIHVSFDGLPATHDRLRGPGAWAQADGALRRLARRLPGRVGVNLLLTRAGLAELEPLAERVAAAGARQLELLRFKPVGRARDSYGTLAPDPRELAGLGPRLRQLVRRHPRLRLRVDCSLLPFLVAGGEAGPPAFLARRGALGCEAGHWLAAAGPDGRWTPCSFWPASADAPDVRDPQGLARLLSQDSPFTALRRAPPPPCASCPQLAVCRGGCRAVALALTGDPLAPDPECPRVRGEAGRVEAPPRFRPAPPPSRRWASPGPRRSPGT